MLNKLFTPSSVFALEYQAAFGAKLDQRAAWRAFFRSIPMPDTGLSSTPYESVTAATPAEAYRLAQSRLVAIKLGALK